MILRVSVTVVVALLSTAQWTSGQGLAASDPSPLSTTEGTTAVPGVEAEQLVGLPPTAPGGVTFTPRPARNPFTSIGHDLKAFFTNRDTRVVMGVFVPAAGIAYTWDQAGIEESQEHLDDSSFNPGNIGGGFWVQMGVAVGTWGIGTVTGNTKTIEVGSDLLRSQITSQVIVQGVKLATRRQRPDGSNYHAFPSGHTSSAFATATVLERHFGWKVGLPAYGFATYVGLARMAANKHHASDVIMGAAVGIASARAVTIGVGGTKFDLGVAPTQGGAAVTFTKK